MKEDTSGIVWVTRRDVNWRGKNVQTRTPDGIMLARTSAGLEFHYWTGPDWGSTLLTSRDVDQLRVALDNLKEEA